MNIFKLAIELFVLYILYKLVFELVIPVFRATRRMKKQIEEAQKKMQQEDPQQKAAKSKQVDGDYIDFEEVK